MSHTTENPGVSLLDGRPRVSFEFFPPKTPELEAKLWETVTRLAPLRPVYVSVTYGAGGTTRDRTHAIVEQIQRELGLEAAAHLTCVGATREEVDGVAARYWEAGIRHIVALRGDPPAGTGRYQVHPGGYPFAADLVTGLRRVAAFELSVAAYPEVHPEAESPQADLDCLKRKLDAGAVRAITQFFFDNDDFYRFVEKARKAGITAPIVPGILPVSNFSQCARFAAMNGAKVPNWLAERFAGLDDDPETRKLVAATVAAEQCQDLWRNGVDQFHFYTLNRADLTFAICHILGVRPAAEAAVAKEASA